MPAELFLRALVSLLAQSSCYAAMSKVGRLLNVSDASIGSLQKVGDLATADRAIHVEPGAVE
jgi:hypothetical protein